MSSVTPKCLNIGGLVAAGFDPTGKYLLTVSHSGCGVFSTDTWERVARDYQIAYPAAGVALGIGPIDGILVRISEIDYATEQLRFSSPDGRLRFEYECGILSIIQLEAQA